MSKIQKIKLKRTSKTLEQLNNTNLDYGEPLYIKDKYFAIGRADSVNIGSSKVVKFQDQSRIDNSVFYTGIPTKTQLTNDSGTNLSPLTTAYNVSYKNNQSVGDALNDILNPNTGVSYATNAGTSQQSNQLKTAAGTSTNYFLLGVADTTSTYKNVYHAGPNNNASKNKNGVYYTASGVLMSAAWNDYAEGRPCDECILPGTCMVEDGEGRLVPSTDYLQPTAGIISDTYGMCLGADYEDAKPIAVAGRVLAYVESKEKLKVGDALKSAPNGKLTKMTRREIRKYPDRIAGIVSEFPTYEKWQDVNVDGRIWVKVK